MTTSLLGFIVVRVPMASTLSTFRRLFLAITRPLTRLGSGFINQQSSIGCSAPSWRFQPMFVLSDCLSASPSRILFISKSDSSNCVACGFPEAVACLPGGGVI